MNILLVGFKPEDPLFNLLDYTHRVTISQTWPYDANLSHAGRDFIPDLIVATAMVNDPGISRPWQDAYPSAAFLSYTPQPVHGDEAPSISFSITPPRTDAFTLNIQECLLGLIVEIGNAHRSLVFDNFEIIQPVKDSSPPIIKWNQQQIQATAQALRLVARLITARGDLVPNEELQAAITKREKVAPSVNGLRVTVNAARRALKEALQLDAAQGKILF